MPFHRHPGIAPAKRPSRSILLPVLAFFQGAQRMGKAVTCQPDDAKDALSAAYLNFFKEGEK